MLNDLIKLFADEPEKVEKAVLRCGKVLLNILIAAWLYKMIVGPYYLFALDSYSEWENFLLSGRVLICLLFYFLCDYLIFQIFTLPGYLFAKRLSKGKNKKRDEEAKAILSFFNVLKYEKEHEIPTPGKNIDVMVEITEAFGDPEASNEIESIRSTFISNVLDLYVYFVFVYTIILPSNIHTTGLNILIAAIGLLLFSTYASIHLVIEYMKRNHIIIGKSLSFIKINALINNVLASYGIYPTKPEDGEGLGKHRAFTLRGKEYILCRPVTDIIVYQREDADLERLLKKRKKPGRVFMIITRQGILREAGLLQRKFANELVLIEYIADDDLREKLNDILSQIK